MANSEVSDESEKFCSVVSFYSISILLENALQILQKIAAQISLKIGIDKVQVLCMFVGQSPGVANSFCYEILQIFWHDVQPSIPNLKFQ